MTDGRRRVRGIDLETGDGIAVLACADPDADDIGTVATDEGADAHSPAKTDSDDPDGREIREYTIPYGPWREGREAGGRIGATDRLEVGLVAVEAADSTSETLPAMVEIESEGGAHLIDEWGDDPGPHATSTRSGRSTTRQTRPETARGDQLIGDK